MAITTKSRIQKAGKIPTGLMMLAFFLTVSVNVAAGQTSKSIQVSAQVLPEISQTVLHQRRTFEITEENISKGFMDIPRATVLRVRTNSHDGYHLSFQVNQHQVREVWVIDNSRTTILSNGISIIQQPNPGIQGEEKNLSYRFYLDPNTKPGTYAWPVSVHASTY